MTNWFNISSENQLKYINQTAALIGLPPVAVEKDVWVTLALKAVFSLPFADKIIFKGGTSLSKAWQLIERFSEDIDLALDPYFLGYKGEPSKNQVDKLRKASCAFVSNELKTAIETQFQIIGVPSDTFSLIARPVKSSDTDPQVLELVFSSLLNQPSYLPQKVLIEVGARSLMEPVADRSVSMLISESFPDIQELDKPFNIPAVLPSRTFLEKVMLIHEEFMKAEEKSKPNRLSRHMYDLHCIMDTEFGKSAVTDNELFMTVAEHRKLLTPVRRLDYSFHTPATINLLPPENMFSLWEEDYKVMQRNMIYGEVPSFQKLMDRMKELMILFQNS